jgi:hypothetical protein
MWSFQAYLQQELEKLQDMRNKAKLEGELWDERISTSSGQNSHLVSKATRLWESILARKGKSMKHHYQNICLGCSKYLYHAHSKSLNIHIRHTHKLQCFSVVY